MSSDRIAYAMDAASFIIQNHKKDITSIILFGSVARGDAEQRSDVDLFIEIPKQHQKIEESLRKRAEEFTTSIKGKLYWKLLNITNDIQLTIGTLKEWESLHTSIIANGITLYGKYSPPAEGKHITLFIWENVKPNSKRVLLNKQLFGHAYRGKIYNGIVQKYKGTRLGKGCISIPTDHAVEAHNVFKKNKVTVRIKKVQEC